MEGSTSLAAIVQDEGRCDANFSHRAYLASTDWYVTRPVETGTAIPDESKAAREAIAGI